jgi:hypothetical protein
MNDRNDKPSGDRGVATAPGDAEGARLSALRLARRRFLVRSGVLGTGAAVAPVAVAHSPATITNMTVTPNSLPPGGGDVVVNATVSPDTALLTLNGAPTSLPATVRVNQTSALTLAAYLAPTTASANVVVAPAPAGTYSLTATGPIYNYGEWQDHVVDARGRIIYAGHGNKGAWGVGDNTIWAYDPVTDRAEVLYPGNGNKQGWVSGEIFVHFYIPTLNCYFRQNECLFDLTTNRILASNIVASKTAAGISDGDTTPTLADAIEYEGNLWKNWMAPCPGQAAHDWCTARSVAIALGSYIGSAQVAVLTWKNPAYPASSTKPLRAKCVYMPLSSRHPDNPTRYGYPIRAQSGAKCRGDWLYLFGPIFKTDYGSLDLTQRRNIALRLNVAAFLATPADQRVPDSACEILPDIPSNPANGDGFCGIPAVTYDSARDRLRYFNYKLWEFDPAGNAYSDVTPLGYPHVAGWCVAYANGAHYLSGGHRALDPGNHGYFLPSAPNSPPFTNGTPTYVDRLRFAKMT